MSRSSGPPFTSTASQPPDQGVTARDAIALCMQAPVGILHMSRQGECTFANRRFRELTGLSEAQLSGFGWVQSLHPEDRDPALATLRSAVDAGAHGSVEFRILRHDGRERWVVGEAVPLHDEQGRTYGVVATLTDVTEHVTRLERYRLLFEHSSEAHLFLDDQACVESCNQAMLRLVGVTSSEALVGKSIFALSPERQPDGLESRDKARAMHALTVLRGSHRFEWVFRHEAGEAVTTEVAMTCLRVEARRAFVAIVHDQTEQKRAEQAVLRSRKDALDALRSKSQFLANMSHEIRTPMNGVLGMLQLSLGTPLSEEQREYLVTAHACGENLLEIIDDILDLSKLEARKLEIEQVAVSLEDVLHDMLRVLAVRAHGKHLELVLRLEPDVPLGVVLDPVRVRQVLTNLLGNAIKFTHAGEVVLSVSRRERGREERLAFHVRDTGIGIENASRERVFEAFSQADGSTTRRYGGTGLGLTISRELVERMGGQLTLQSELGRGSDFGFDLPLHTAPVSTPPLESAPPMRVVVASAHESTREALALLLARLGHEASVCASLAEASAQLASARALLIHDRLLPAEGATELLSPLEGLRLVVLQSHDLPRGHVEASAPRARKLQTPVLPRDLAAALGAHAASWSPSSSPRTSMPALRRLSVLLVEDNPVNTQFLTVLLQRQGHEVLHAPNGAEAIKTYLSQPFDVIFMDVQMPVMDGFEAARRIRALEGDDEPRTPIVALTAHAMQGDAEACLAAGMDRYLSKPIDTRALSRLLREMFGHEAAASPGKRLRSERVDTRPFDRGELFERTSGDPSFTGDLLRTFLTAHDEMTSDVARALADDDLDALRKAAHRLKGALQVLCANPAVELAETLEASARAGQREGIPRTAAALSCEMTRLVEALRAELAMLERASLPSLSW